jgi:alcohol dehydrogenase
MTTKVAFGTGAFVRRLPMFVAGSERILVIATAGRLEAIPIEDLLQPAPVAVFSAFTVNPRLDDVLRAAALRERLQPDLIIGLGGGSALDVAKAARILPSDDRSARAWLDQLPVAGVPFQPPLIVIPTVAGSGSEVTRFATMYAGGEKKSLDGAAVRANVAIVDPALAATCSGEVRTAAALDAFAHSVESWWSRASTSASRDHSRAALAQLVPMLREGLADGVSAATRERLALASLAAGRAIDETRTTAAHAFSYRLTLDYGIPHGIACALNLQWVARYNSEFGRACYERQARGLGAALGVGLAELPDFIADLLVKNGWPPCLRAYGVCREDLLNLAVRGIQLRSRVENNPARLVLKHVHHMLKAIY